MPDPNWLTESYLDEIARARRFVAEHRLAPLPAGERLEIADTPPFQRGYAPWTTYQAPAAFDADSVGTFCITPVDLRRGEAEQRRQLEGHCLPRLPLTVVHELWPGHHLQRVHAHEAATRLRRLASSELFLEGWALHAESVMHDHGYFTHPLTRLFQLRHRLWRACRVVLDTALHTGRMSLEEGVALLEREVGLERAHAMAEVHRTCLQPTRMLGGLVGALLLEELEQEVRGALGERFTLLDFHAAVLAGGSLPITLVREDLVARWGFA